jgi:uncharacterized membrane protein
MNSRLFISWFASFFWLAASFAQDQNIAHACTMKLEWVCKYRNKSVLDLYTNKFVYRLVYGCEHEPNFCAPSSTDTPLSPTSSPSRTTWTGWKFCNKTNQEKLSIAYTYNYMADWITKGWIDVPKGKCVTPVSKIHGSYAYFYVRNVGMKWAGKQKNVCFDSKKDFFLAYLSPPGFTCLEPNESALFNEVETVDADKNPAENWTTNITADMISEKPTEMPKFLDNLFKDNQNIFKDLEFKL